MIYDRLADSIIKHPKAIVIAWVIILLVSSAFAIRVGEVMTYDTTDMAPEESDSIIGMRIMEDYFPSSDTSETAVPILVLPYEDTAGMIAAQDFVSDLDAATEHHPHISSVMAMDPSSTTGKGIVMAMLMVEDVDDVISYTPEFRNFVSEVKSAVGYGSAAYVTGMTAISYDMEHNSLEDISKIDPFTVLLILIFIGLFFRSFVSSAAPPMTIGVAFVVTTALIFWLGQVMNIFFITNMMILVSMMGAGCDYCIFIIARYREELRSGMTHEDALRSAIVWAGESITISGAAVIIGFGAMAICNYSLISTMGICLALAIIIALFAALTFIPSVLALIGDKIFWPTTMKAFEEGGKATKGWYAWFGEVSRNYFHKSAKFSLKHAKAIVVAAILVTVPAAYVVATTETSYDMISSMLSGDSGDGMSYISEYADQGLIMPDYTVIEYKHPLAEVIAPDEDDEDSMGSLIWNDYWRDSVSPGLDTLYATILLDDNIVRVNGPFEWDRMLQAVDDAGLSDATPEEKIEYIKSISSTKVGMFIDALMDKLEEDDVDLEVMFKSISQILDEEAFEELERRLHCDLPSWSDMVQQAKQHGLTDNEEIIDWVVNSYAGKIRSAVNNVGALEIEANKSLIEAGVIQEMIEKIPGMAE